MQEFLEKYSPNTSYFGDVKLSGPCPEVDFKDQTTQDILEQVRPNDVWTCVACSYFIYKKLT